MAPAVVVGSAGTGVTDLLLPDPIYIAGPMTGRPELNYPAFNAVEAALRAMNYRVENPAVNANYAPEGADYAWFIRAGLLQLLRCRSIVLLDGWEESRGATLEHLVAEAMGLPQYEWKDVEWVAQVVPFRLAREKS